MEKLRATKESSDQITANWKQKVPGDGPALQVVARPSLVAVVIVVVPVTIGSPAVAVFIPPAMTVLPAPGACLGQFVAILCGLRAVPAVVLDCFMKFVIRVGYALLAVVVRA